MRHHLLRRPFVAVLAAGLLTAATALAQGTLEKPGLVTSAGQSSDIAIVKVMLNTQGKLGLEVKPLAKPADLAGMKTLIVVLGASTKGLGAAGVDMEQEIARTKALLKAAKEQGIKVVALHTGGESRRGKTSNDLIQVVVPEADQVVVVASGNKDKSFNTLAAKKATPIVEVDRQAAAGEALRGMFK